MASSSSEGDTGGTGLSFLGFCLGGDVLPLSCWDFSLGGVSCR